MPTKHKRKRGEDESHFNLEPTTKAKSLPVIEPTKDFITSRKKQKLDINGKSKRVKKSTDDTPKAFARLMAWHKDGRKIGGGLDNGNSQPKKPKKKPAVIADSSQNTKTDGAAATEALKTQKELKIQPGESLRDFSLRVDQSLPLSSLPKQNANPNAALPEDLREKEKKAKYLTKHNKRLARMQSEWRNTEAKLKAKEEAEADENVEKLEEQKLLWDSVRMTGKKGKKKIVDDDPWKELEKKRRAEEGRLGKGRNVAGLAAKDQVQAPPTLGKIKNIFREKPNVGKPRSVKNGI